MNPIDTLDALEAKLQPPGAQPPADPYAGDNSFVRGIRSGGFGAGSQLSTLAGAVGETLGADQFAKAAYAKGRGLRDDASRAAPLINQWSDVHGAGDFGSYVAGQVGASLPAAAGALGAAALTGGGAVPAMVAAGAAMAPLEIGDVVQRQHDRGEATDLGTAALYGGGSAALQGIVPGLARVKLAGGLGASARQTLRQAVVKESAAIPEQAVLGTAGEGLKQYGTAGELDPTALGEAFASNAAGGLPFAAAGVAGRTIHGGAGVPGSQMVGDAFAKGREALKGASKAVGDAVPRTESGGIDLGSIKESVEDTARRVANGLPMREHLDKIRTAAEDMLPDTAMAEAKDRMTKATTWAGDLVNDAGLTPEVRANVAAAAKDLTKDANVKIVAGAMAAREAGKSALGAIGDFYKSVTEKFTAGKAKVDAEYEGGIDVGPKQSRVYDGMRQAIANIIAPIVEQNYPQALHDPAARNRLAEALRVTAERMSQGKEIPAEHQRYMRILFGDEYTDVLGAIGEAMVDSGKTPKFMAQLNKLDAAEAEGKSRRQRLTEALPDHSRAELSQIDEQLQRFMSPEFTRGLDRATAELRLRNARRQIAKTFGDKADVILEAYGPQAREENQLQAAGRPLEADKAGDGVDFTDRLEEGGTELEVVSKKPVLSPGNAMKEYGDEPGQTKAEREIARAEKREGVRARWVSAAEYAALTGKDASDVPEGHGFVVAETLPAGDALSARELSAMKWDKQKQAKDKTQHDSLIEAGPHKFDAIKVAKVMLATLPSDERSSQVRMADAFMQGVAKLTEHYGDVVNVPDSTVIVKNGKKSLTYGEAKKLNLNAVEAKGNGEEAVARTHDELKAALARAETDYDGAKRDGASAEELAKIARRSERIERDLAKIRVTDAATDGSPREMRWRVPDMEQRLVRGTQGGAYEVNPETDIHSAAAVLNADELRHKFNMDGTPVKHGGSEPNMDRSGQITPNGLRVLDSFLSRVETKRTSQGANATQRAALAKLADAATQHIAALQADPGALNSVQTRNLIAALHPDQKLSAAMELMPPVRNKPAAKVDAPARDVLTSKPKLDAMVASENYAALDTRAKVDEFLKRAEARYKELGAERDRLFKTDEDLPAAQQAAFVKLSDMFGEGSTFDRESLYDGLEGSPDPKALAAKKAAFLERARSGDKALIEEIGASTDIKGMQRAIDALPADAAPGVVDALNTRMGELLRDPDNSYGVQLLSRQRTNPNGTTTPQQRAEVTSYIRDVLGPQVKTVFANIMHAGEFEPGRPGVDDIVRVSVHSLNPMSVAYHESLHGLFARLINAPTGTPLGNGNVDVINVLKRAADGAVIKNQLRKLLAGEPDALRQLEDPEERAAYMYQFWATKDANGKRLLEVGTQTHGVFERIKAALLKVLGVWTNDERALRIMAAFHDGKFKDPATTSAAARAIMAAGRNATLDKVGAMTQPLRHLGESIVASGGAKLRETGVPALSDVANGMKRALHDEGEDQGFVPAARTERTLRMNKLAHALESYTPDEMNEALVAMQSGTKPASLNARVIARVTKNVLREAFTYMKDAGVKLNDLGEDYFPRVYDTAKIEADRVEFESMLTAHGYDGKAIADKLIANGGVYTNVVDRPGMQHTKQRKLVDIPDALVQPYLKSDFVDTMSSYMYQATRRAEWARRWGDEGERLEAKLGEARRQGATPEQLDDARKFIRGVDGTLGDDINPNMRKLFGTAIAYQNVRLLPLAIFSSVVDPVGIIVRGGTVREGWSAFKRGMKEAIPAARGTLANDHWAEMAEIMGVVDAAALSHTMGEIYGQGMMGDTTRKINDAFFRYNLMEGFNRSMRVAATEAAARFIGRHADLKASEHSARWIAELGLRPEDILRNPDGSVKLSERDGLTPEQAGLMRAAVNKWVDGAVLRPDSVDKPVWMNDPHWALVSHLKQFTYAFHETILKRVIHEHKFGNYKPAMAMASYVPIMIAADLLKSGITPNDPEWDNDAGSMLMHGVERGGVLGVGQFALDMGHGLGGLTGPTIEQLIESVEVLGGRRSFQSFALRAMPANSLYVGDGAESASKA